MSETKTQTYKRLDWSKLKLAPVSELISMPRFWQATGDRQLAKATCKVSRNDNLWLDTGDMVRRIHAGRKFKIIQQLEEDKEYECLVQVMEPNPEVSAENIKDIEKEFGAESTLAFIDAQKNGHTQVHFASVIE